MYFCPFVKGIYKKAFKISIFFRKMQEFTKNSQFNEKKFCLIVLTSIIIYGIISVFARLCMRAENDTPRGSRCGAYINIYNYLKKEEEDANL